MAKSWILCYWIILAKPNIKGHWKCQIINSRKQNFLLHLFIKMILTMLAQYKFNEFILHFCFQTNSKIPHRLQNIFTQNIYCIIGFPEHCLSFIILIIFFTSTVSLQHLSYLRLTNCSETKNAFNSKLLVTNLHFQYASFLNLDAAEIGLKMEHQQNI